MDDFSNISNLQEEPDIKIEDTTTDSLVFSVTYENYQNNILNDKENKTLGQWEILKENFGRLKFAYAYLKGSERMIVKKYQILNFEYSNIEKGYDKDWKVCFVFSSSENVFFEYPYSGVVQGRQYKNSTVMDASPKLSAEEVQRRLDKSKNTPVVNYVGEKRTRTSSGSRKRNVKFSTRDRIVKIYQEKFKDKKLKKLSDVDMLIQQVEGGKEPEDVLASYFQAE
ncbi:MAG: hypothetical protein O3B39_04250 [Proteobacteria bacterium]|jgi:hypothetical protein|nr:hypothetical protein [Pseudomonadota bacterium]